MRDHWIFAAAPYVAAGIAIAVMAVRFALAKEGTGPQPARSRPFGTMAHLAWIAAIGLVALAHVAALAFPDAVLLWTRNPLRLVAIEVEGLIAGAVAVAGTLAVLAQAMRRRPVSTAAVMDVAALTLVAVSMLSGVLMAVLYRWASSWAEVTLVPYLYSVAYLDPATSLVTRLPMLVKLHVASAFALVALAPCTSIGGRAAAVLARAMRAFASPARQTIGRWTAARLQTASAVMFGNGEEEN
jgi:nitrate reductase gamma subunit